MYVHTEMKFYRSKISKVWVWTAQADRDRRDWPQYNAAFAGNNKWLCYDFSFFYSNIRALPISRSMGERSVSSGRNDVGL